MAAIAIADDRSGLSRDAGVLAIVQGIIGAAYQSDWGLDFAHPAEPASASRLYSAGLDKQGVALWAVRWKQTVRLLTPDAGQGVVQPRLYLGLVPESATPAMKTIM